MVAVISGKHQPLFNGLLQKGVKHAGVNHDHLRSFRLQQPDFLLDEFLNLGIRVQAQTSEDSRIGLRRRRHHGFVNQSFVVACGFHDIRFHGNHRGVTHHFSDTGHHVTRQAGQIAFTICLDDTGDGFKAGPTGIVLARDHLLCGFVILLTDIVIDTAAKGLDVLVINLFLNLGIIRVHPGNLVLVHVHLTEQGFFQIFFVPRGQDHCVIHLTQFGKRAAFVDFLLDLGDQHLFDDPGDQLALRVQLLVADLAQTMMVASDGVLQSQIVTGEHHLHFAFNHKGGAVFFVDRGLFRHDPDLVIGINGDITGAELLISLFADIVPEFLSELIFGIHQRRHQLLEHIVLCEQITAHFRPSEGLGHDVVFLQR